MNIKITDATIITNDEEDKILYGAELHIKGGKISYVGRPGGASGETFDREIKAGGGIVMPGFVNLHTHTPMTLLRGFADDYSLQEWLFDMILPAEDRMTEEMVYWAALAAMYEFAAAGVTCFNEMYDYSDAIARAVKKSGMRAVLSRGVASGASAGETAKKLAEACACYDKYHGDGRIKVFMAPHAEYTTDDGLLKKMAVLAKERDTGVHVHVSETKKEHEDCLARRGKTPTEVFELAGLMDVPFVGAHCVWVSNGDIDILSKHRASVATCPRSNLKLASGIAPVRRMLEAGVNVGIGTDGAASNNKLSVMSEMTLTSLLQKGTTYDPKTLPARQAVKLATLSGAAALGFEGGVISEGKNADVIMFDSGGIRCNPHYDPLSSVVYSLSDSDVRLTIVDGGILYEDGKCAFADLGEITDRLNTYSKIVKYGDKR